MLIKNFTCFFLTICLIFAAISVMPVPVVSASGAVFSSLENASDVLLLLRLIVSGEPIEEEQLAIADLNGDGEVTTADALIALKRVTGISDPQLFMMTMRDDMLAGDAVDFCVPSYQIGGKAEKYENGSLIHRGFDAAIANSLQELQKIYRLDFAHLEFVGGIKKYDYNFFIENAVVVIFVMTSPLERYISSVVTKNDELCIEFFNTSINCASVETVALIEVKKADVVHVQQITCFTQAFPGPRPKDPATLSTVIENQIEEDWLNKDPEYWSPGHEVTRINYYGTYNDWIAVKIYDNFSDGPTMSLVQNVDGIVFGFNIISTIHMWKSGDFLRFHEAYEQGLITRENLMDIAYYHHSVLL